MRTRTTVMLLAGAIALCWSALAAAATTFTLSTPDPDSASITVAAKNFAEIVKKKSNGEIDIKVFPNGTLYGADPTASVKQLSSGSLDMLLLATGVYSNFKPKFIIITFPYLFDNSEQFRAFLNSDIKDVFDGEIGSLGIQPLGYWPRPPRVITNSKTPIRNPGDLKGVKLRVPNNPIWAEFFQAMGAAPTPMTFGEVYNALQLKVVDGQENPITIPMDAKFYEVQKYLTFTNHIYEAWVLGMNQAKWNALPDATKKIFREASMQAQLDKIKYDSDGSDSTEKFLVGKGMETYRLTPDEQAQFVAIAKKLYPRFAELVKDPDLVKKAMQFVGK